MKSKLREFIRSHERLDNYFCQKIKPIYIRCVINKTTGLRAWYRFSLPFLHWLFAGHVIRRLRIRRYLDRCDGTFKLQIGGGPYSLADWLNGDLINGNIFLNALHPLPFSDDSVDYIFTEHFIEHLTLKEGMGFLSESYRILKPGGILRQGTPSLTALMDIYMDRHSDVSRDQVINRHNKVHHPKRPCLSPADYFNEVMRLWGHRFIYDADTLELLYRKAGLINLKWKKFGQSEHIHLQNLEQHADLEWVKTAFVIILEGQKPLSRTSNEIEN